MVLWQSGVRVGNVCRLVLAVAGYCCTEEVLLCTLGTGMRTYSVICVHRLCCLNAPRAQSKPTHLLQDAKVRAEPRCVVVARSSVSCRGFQRDVCEADTRGVGCGGGRDGVMWLLLVVIML